MATVYLLELLPFAYLIELYVRLFTNLVHSLQSMQMAPFTFSAMHTRYFLFHFVMYVIDIELLEACLLLDQFCAHCFALDDLVELTLATVPFSDHVLGIEICICKDVLLVRDDVLRCSSHSCHLLALFDDCCSVILLPNVVQLLVLLLRDSPTTSNEAFEFSSRS